MRFTDYNAFARKAAQGDVFESDYGDYVCLDPNGGAPLCVYEYSRAFDWRIPKLARRIAVVHAVREYYALSSESSSRSSDGAPPNPSIG